MPNGINLVEDTHGVLRWMTDEEVAGQEPAQSSDSTTRMRSSSGIDDGFLEMLDEAARSLDMVSVNPKRNPAENFAANAKGEPWFIKAEMEIPRGGRRVNGRVARRQPQLVVTVKRGGKEAAQRILDLMEEPGRIVERRPTPQGRLSGRRR